MDVASADVCDVASWNRERTLGELRQFIEARHALLPVDIAVD